MSSMLFLLPISNANVTPFAAPAIGLSATSGAVGDYITVNGTGFPSSQTAITFTYVRVSDNTIVGSAVTRYPSLVSAGNLAADANGYFKVQVQLPATIAGAYILRTTYTPAGGVATDVNTTVTLNTKLSFGASSSFFPGDAITWTVSGFGGNELVSITGVTPAIFAGGAGTVGAGQTFVSAVSGNTDTNGGLALVTAVNDVAGGAKTITATGATSGLSATATLTVKNDTVLPSVSIRRTAGATITATLRGFTLGTSIAANSITIGAAGTAHSAVTITNTGTAVLPITLTSDLITQGLVNVTIAGTVFSWNSGNIKTTGFPATDAGALIASNPNTGATNTAIIILDKSSYSVGDSVKIFGAGFVAADAGTIAAPNGAGGINTAIGLAASTSSTADANGAFYAKFTLLAVAKDDADADRTIDYTAVAPADNPAGVIISIIPKLTSPTSSTTVTFPNTITITGTGFSIAEDISFTVGGAAFSTPILAGAISAVGGFTTGAVATPDLAAGSQPVVAAGATAGNSASSSFSVAIVVAPNALSAAGVTPPSGPAGTTVNINTNTAATAPNLGIHGLKASTLYNVKFGGEAGQTISSFRSSATGTVPSTARFNAPTGILGINIIDIVDASTSVSVIWSKAQVAATAQFTNLVYGLTATVLTTPSAGFVNDTITVVANSLKPNTLYEVDFNFLPITTFNSTATGTVPTGVNFTVPATPTAAGLTKAGTSITIELFDVVAGGAAVGTGSFTLFATLTVSPVKGPQGSLVTITGTGWEANTNYAVVFGGDLSATPVVTGRTVAPFTADGIGNVPVNTYFTVPADLAAGNYWIDVVAAGTSSPSVVLQRIQFTIGQVVPPVGTGSFTPAAPALLNSAGATVASIAHGAQFYTGMNVTSNVATALSVTVIAQIKDSSGRVVALGLAAADIAAGAVKAVQVPFIGVNTAGTYTVTLFVWDNIATATPLAPTTTFNITVS